MSEMRSAAAPTINEDARAGSKASYVVLMVAIVALDAVTKLIAQRELPPYQPVPVLGDVVRLTYIYNPGAAFGLHLGDYSRYIFLVLTVVVLGVLYSWFRTTPATDRLRLLAIAVVASGAIGNLIDRVRSARGVVDFIDIGFGTTRWPVFNVADIAVTMGALLLAISLWREEQAMDSGDD